MTDTTEMNGTDAEVVDLDGVREQRAADKQQRMLRAMYDRYMQNPNEMQAGFVAAATKGGGKEVKAARHRMNWFHAQASNSELRADWSEALVSLYVGGIEEPEVAALVWAWVAELEGWDES